MTSSASPSSEKLTSLLYRSAAIRPFGPDDLLELETKSGAANRAAGISGYLTYRSGSFTQYLEGPGDAVAALYKNITHDPRHAIGTTVILTIGERRFPGWSMRLLDPLWHPTGDALDAIDELLQVPDARADDPVVSEALHGLLAQVMV